MLTHLVNLYCLIHSHLKNDSADLPHFVTLILSLIFVAIRYTTKKGSLSSTRKASQVKPIWKGFK